MSCVHGVEFRIESAQLSKIFGPNILNSGFSLRRRDVLIGLASAAFLAATAPSRTYPWNVSLLSRASNDDAGPFLKIGFNQNCSWLLLASAERFLLRLQESGFIAGAVFYELNDSLLFDRARTGELDAVVSATAYHPRLPAEGHVLGTLPLNMSSAEKLSWLSSKSGMEFQDNFFLKKIGVKSDLIFVASSTYGFYSSVAIDSKTDFASRTGSALGSRRAWWQALGVATSNQSPPDAFASFARRELDFSPLLSNETNLLMMRKSRFDSANPLFYKHSKYFASAPVGHILWNPDVRERLAALNPGFIETARENSLSEAIAIQAQVDKDALSQIGQFAEVSQLSPEIENSIKDFSRQLRGSFLRNTLFSCPGPLNVLTLG